MLTNQTLAWSLQILSDTPVTVYWRALIPLYQEASFVHSFWLVVWSVFLEPVQFWTVRQQSVSSFACHLKFLAYLCEFLHKESLDIQWLSFKLLNKLFHQELFSWESSAFGVLVLISCCLICNYYNFYFTISGNSYWSLFFCFWAVFVY